MHNKSPVSCMVNQIKLADDNLNWIVYIMWVSLIFLKFDRYN